jgi:hypothetical protein
MKYIIKESQLSKLKDKISLFQEILDKKLEYVKDGCDKSYNEFPDDISFNACDEAELIEKLNILTIKFVEGIFVIDIEIVFKSIRPYRYFDDFLYNLKQIIRGQMGLDVELKGEKLTNKNTFNL